MANCVDYDVNPLYPFTQLNDVNELFRRVRIRNLDNMIYNPFDSNDDDIEPDLYALNSIQFDIPLSSYMFDPDTIPINNDCIKLRSFNIRSSTLHLEQFLDCQNSSFDILCLCETRLTEEHYKSVHIESFHSFHQGRNRLLRTYVRNTYHHHLQEIFLAIAKEYTDWASPQQHPMQVSGWATMKGFVSFDCHRD